jgi:hypothetical protein
MDDFVGTNVASLSKAFPADVALIWSFAGVTALVRLPLMLVVDSARYSAMTYLKIPSLGKALITSLSFAYLVIESV